MGELLQLRVHGFNQLLAIEGGAQKGFQNR
jgi:hypothetical protein